MSYKKLGEIANVRRGASPRPIDDPKYFGGEVGWVRISDVSASGKYLRKTTQYVSPLGESMSIRVDSGDLIMSIAATVGKSIIVDMPACIHDGFVHIYNLRGITSEYLYYCLSHLEKEIIGLGQAGTQVNINSEIVRGIRLYVPPMKEQIRITDLLSRIDTLIAQTGTFITKHERLRAGLLNDLLTRGIDNQGHLRSEKTHEFKDSAVGRIPQEWNTAALEELGKWQGGLTPSKKRPDYWHNGSHLWISPKDIERGPITDSEDKISDEAVKYLKIYPANRNIIVVFRSGVLRHSFPVCYCTKPFSVNQDLKVLIPKSGIEAQFVFLTLQQYEPLIVSKIVKHGTTVESVDAEAFYALQVPLPSQDEQISILGVVSNCDSKIENLRSRLQKFNRLRAGLMHDLLMPPTASMPAAILQEAEALLA